MEKSEMDLIGCIYGRLEVTKISSISGNVICVCECGETIDVRIACLKRGRKSCGCLRHADYLNKKVGKLLVIEKVKNPKALGFENKSQMIYWKCICDCGKECYKTSGQLNIKKLNYSISCGCLLELSQKNFGKRTTFLDLTGKTFKNYTVINESPDRSKGGSVMWNCNCHLCGRFFLMPQTAYKKDNPCNCLWAIRKKEIGARLYKEQVQKFHVEGTFLPLLLKEDNVNNTSGVRGVSFNEKTGRWVAYMSFKGKNVLRKSFECKEEAIRERRKAELFYFRPVLKKYVSEGVL